MGRLFIKTLYGIEFIESYNVSIMLFIGTIPMIFYKLIHPIYISIGKQKVVTKILFVAVSLNVILNLKFIPLYGIMGAATASVASYGICGMIFALKFKNDYNFEYISMLIKFITKINKRLKQHQIGRN